MPIPRLLLATALTCLAAVAAAQTEQPPAAPEKQGGLSDLEVTVNELRDEAQPAEAPPRPAETPPAQTPPAQTPPPAATPTRPAPPLTGAQRAEVVRAIARGRQLIAIAVAGQFATEDMLSRVPNPGQVGIDGWIAEPQGNGMTVTFYANGEDGPKTVYRANVLGGRVVSRDAFLGSFRPPLSRAQARLSAARDATNALESRACGTRPFNVFVVPPAGGSGTVEVYQLSTPAERGRYPIGGHYRHAIGENGRVASTHAFAEGCPEIEATDPPAGQQPRPIPVSGQADPLPTEVQVLMSQLSRRALIVTAGTPARQWLIAGDRVAEIRDGAVQPFIGEPPPTSS